MGINQASLTYEIETGEETALYEHKAGDKGLEPYICMGKAVISYWLHRHSPSKGCVTRAALSALAHEAVV